MLIFDMFEMCIDLYALVSIIRTTENIKKLKKASIQYLYSELHYWYLVS